MRSCFKLAVLTGALVAWSGLLPAGEAGPIFELRAGESYFRVGGRPAFVLGLDHSGFRPLPCVFSAGVTGAVLGSDTVRLAWCRDVDCAPPVWLQRPLLGQTLAIEVPGAAWQVEFIDPVSGRSGGTMRLAIQDRRLQVALPEFEGSIALRLTRQE
jgi:hypothetical protein